VSPTPSGDNLKEEKAERVTREVFSFHVLCLEINLFLVKITFPITYGLIRSYSKLIFHFLFDFEIFVLSKKRGAFVTIFV
jgi:hypothetical protein